MSYQTAIARSSASLPARWLAARGYLRGRKLDYGCGRGTDAMVFFMDGYDPHWFPQMPKGKYDTITCTFVLNTVEPADVQDIVLDIFNRLRPHGKAYITVRRDIVDGQLGRGCFQRLVSLPFPVVRETAAYCIYEVSK